MLTSTVISMMGKALGVSIADTQELVQTYLSNKDKIPRGFWPEVDRRLGAVTKKTSPSYKRFIDTIVPRFQTSWPEETVQRVCEEACAITQHNRRHLKSLSSYEQFIAFREETMKRLEDLFGLRKPPMDLYPFKRIQDAMRHAITRVVAVDLGLGKLTESR